MISSLQAHNAQKTLADVRDHLARHDKPIAFFFGAGTSWQVAKRPEGELYARALSNWRAPVNVCRN